MCGIFGGVGQSVINAMDAALDALHHRGPDDKGKYVDDEFGVGLGHTRLSIIDLSQNAHQPMTSPDGSLTLVFNGEIYNYRDLRNELQQLGEHFTTNSDTEVVLKAYQVWGSGCLERFRGMFAFGVYDKAQKKLILARDRFGIKPLLYTATADGFAFSSELRPFLKTGLVERVLSNKGLSTLVELGSVSQPDTIVEGVSALKPGHYLELKVGSQEHKIIRYFDVSSSVSSGRGAVARSYIETVSSLKKELEEATNYHLVSDVEVGAFLSGGVDSTAVVALMKQASPDAMIKTFTVGFDSQNYVADESEVAKRSAKALKTQHHSIVVDDGYIQELFDTYIESIDQPSLDGINTYIVCREASKDVKVVLSGLGGDELYAGYRHFKDLPEYSNSSRHFLTWFARIVHKMKPNRFTRRYLFLGLPVEQSLLNLRMLFDPNKVLNRGALPAKELAPSSDLTDVQRISLHEFNGYLLSTLLRDCDALSMASSIEVRPVLLDHKLVIEGLNYPDNYKVREGKLKSCFVDAVKEIVPEEVYSRRKTGFEMPFVKWMNGVLWERFDKVLNDKVAEDIFKPSFLNSIRKRCRRKRFKRNDWLVLVLLSWVLLNRVRP